MEETDEEIKAWWTDKPSIELDMSATTTNEKLSIQNPTIEVEIDNQVEDLDTTNGYYSQVQSSAYVGTVDSDLSSLSIYDPEAQHIRMRFRSSVVGTAVLGFGISAFLTFLTGGLVVKFPFLKQVKPQKTKFDRKSKEPNDRKHYDHKGKEPNDMIQFPRIVRGDSDVDQQTSDGEDDGDKPP